jgi:hypothetical protein
MEIQVRAVRSGLWNNITFGRDRCAPVSDPSVDPRRHNASGGPGNDQFGSDEVRLRKLRERLQAMSDEELIHFGRALCPYFLLIVLGACLVGCKTEAPQPTTKLVYFGFDNRAEGSEDIIRLAKTWGDHPPCPHWRATIKKEEADYELFFGVADVTITDRRGQVLYTGGTGVLYMPHGNPEGSGVNICKLTGE